MRKAIVLGRGNLISVRPWTSNLELSRQVVGSSLVSLWESHKGVVESDVRCGSSYQFYKASSTFTLGSLFLDASKTSYFPGETLRHEGDALRRLYSSASEPVADVAGIVQIELAQTGEGIADGELLRWFVQEGDFVEEFQPLCEVQSDKASVEITSRYKGRVTKVNFLPNEIVKVGETLLELLVEGGNSRTLAETEKGHDADVSAESSTEIAKADHGSKAVITTPAVRHLAKSYGVNLEDICGSGKDGRILKEDLLKFVSSKEELNDELRAIEPAGASLASFSDTSDSEVEENVHNSKETLRLTNPFGDSESVTAQRVFEDLSEKDEIIPVRGFRRIMAKTMAAAVSVPHFHYMEDINVDGLVHLRESLKDFSLGQGVKLTYLPFLLKALSVALKKFPLLNSTVNKDVSEIRLRASHHIGVGMATNAGLVVPNIKNVQNLSVLEIAQELARLSQLAATNSLSSEDITGGTITVSNFGSIGGKYGSPVLNTPEVAILAIGKLQKLPRYAENGSVYPAHIMGVTWGADHRVVDGATVAGFCNEWKSIIEQPGRLIINLR